MTALVSALAFATARTAGGARDVLRRGVPLQGGRTTELTPRVSAWHNTGQGGRYTNCASAVEPLLRHRAMRSKGET